MDPAPTAPTRPARIARGARVNRAPWLVGLGVLLALGITIYATRVARHFQLARLELGAAKLSDVDGASAARLAGLSDRCLVTFFVSPRREMPSQLRDLEAGVHGLLEAMRTAARGRFDYQVLDPDTEPDFARYASKRKVVPTRVRSVEHDGWSERVVWSSLVISYGAHPPAVLNGLTAEHLPRLQTMVLGYLDQLERPRRPLVALCPPAPPSTPGGAPAAGTSELQAALAERCDVRVVDLSGDAPWPADADVVFWIDPGPIAARRLEELEEFIASGRSAVVAGSARRIEIAVVEEQARLRVEATGFDPGPLLARFGLRAAGDLVLDTMAELISVGGANQPAPFLLRCIAPNQDFHTMRGEANGTLLFSLPTAIEPDGPALARLGLDADVLGTTSDKTWVQPVPGPAAELALADFNAARGESAPKQPLMVCVGKPEPWHGKLVVCGASTPFIDGFHVREGTAHWRLLRTLVDTLASSERLVVHRTGLLRSEPLPPLASSERLVWRAIALGLFPALLAALALARRRGAAGTDARAPRAAPVWRGLAFKAAAGLIVVGAAAHLARALPLALDLTAGRLNQVSPSLAELAARAEGTRLDLVFSERGRLPPELRAALPEAERLAAAIERAGDVEVRRTTPEDLSEPERSALAERGLAPVDASSKVEEVRSVRSVWSGILLARGEHSEVVPLPDAAAFEDLEFKLAFALWKLEQGRPVPVAFASDVPRWTPAEAYEYYQQQGKFAPMGTDIYSVARERVRLAGFDVRYVNPRDPKLPEEFDALVWLQPRRDVSVMYDYVARYLHHGGNVFLSAQHFKIQSRQYPGRNNYEYTYWPGPELPDVEVHYFPEIGLNLLREIVYDELFLQMPIESQVNRASNRDFRSLDAALPFLIRASAANFADLPFLEGVTDQAFLFASDFTWDATRFAELGLEATPLITTSDHTWTFAWKNGFLVTDAVKNAPVDAAGRPLYQGRLPLAVEVAGTFPLPEARIVKYIPGKPGETAQTEFDWPPADFKVPGTPGAPGRLLFVGTSEPFKDHRLLDENLRGDQLLVNSVAELTLPDELVGLLGRRRVARGLDYVSEETRVAWRALVLGVPVALVIALALANWIAGRAGNTGARLAARATAKAAA